MQAGRAIGCASVDQRRKNESPERDRHPAHPGRRFAAPGTPAQKDERRCGKGSQYQEPGQERAHAVAAAAIETIEQRQRRQRQCGDADCERGIDRTDRHCDPGR